MKLTELQTMLLSIDGEMALSVLGAGKRRLFQVWFFVRGRDYRGTGSTLAEAVEKAMSSGELTKRCTGPCGQVKALREFPKCPDKTDGRASQCLGCDRQRKSKWYPRKARPRPITGSGLGSPTLAKARRSQRESLST